MRTSFDYVCVSICMVETPFRDCVHLSLYPTLTDMVFTVGLPLDLKVWPRPIATSQIGVAAII